MNRTQKLFKSIKLSLAAKVCGILVSLMMTPILYKTLGTEKYGVWATILPIFTWFTFFDFGIGNGLRNVITECVALHDYAKARKYISNAFLMCSLFGAVFFVLLLLFIFFRLIFPNLVVIELDKDVLYSVYVVIGAAILAFVFGLINHLHHSLQQSYYVIYSQLLNSVIILLLLCPVYLHFIDNSVLFTSSIYSFSLVSSLIVSAWLFFRKYKFLIPLIEDFNLNPKFFVLKTGSAFFILQLSSLIIFSSDKLMITSFVGAAETSGYDIAYKYFSIVVFLQSIITTPSWGAVADAVARKDTPWIDKAVKIQLGGFVLILILLVSLLLMSSYIFPLWIGTDFKVDKSMLLWMVLFISIMSWNNIFSAMLSGAGVLRFQVLFALMAVVINIPLSITLLVYFELSAESVLMSTSISLSLFAIFAPYVLRKKIQEVKSSVVNCCNSNI
ncbi:lipopolysaccharide biosynthesis protein [Pseudaeromonas pectinilytica]